MTTRHVPKPAWFNCLRAYSFLTLCVQLVLEFPKLAYMLDARTSGVYTVFPPIIGEAVSGSSWWWLVVHLLTTTMLTFAVQQQLLWRRAGERLHTRTTWQFKALTAFVTTSIVANSNHFGPAPAWVGVVVQCSLVAIVVWCIFVVGLQSDAALAVFVLVFTLPNWITFGKYAMAFGFPLSAATSLYWTVVGVLWLAFADVLPWFHVSKIHKSR